MEKRIDEKIFIELYNANKTSDELAGIFKCGQRTIERYETRLRKQGKIDYRKNLNGTIGEEKYNHSEILEEVGIYLDNAKTVLSTFNDPFKEVKLKSSWDKAKQTEDLAQRIKGYLGNPDFYV